MLDDGHLGSFSRNWYPARRFMVVAVNGHAVEEDTSVFVPQLSAHVKKTWLAKASCKLMEVVVDYQFVA